MTITMTAIEEQGQLPASIRRAIQAAQSLARRMSSSEVEPEHLFLSILAQNDDGAAQTFRALRLNQRMLRKQAAALFPTIQNGEVDDAEEIALSREVQTCLDWAALFAAHLQAEQVQLEHVLLGCIRHGRLQSLLALFLLNAGNELPAYLTTRSELVYTATMDQIIAARIRRDHLVGSDPEARTLNGVERPTTTFSDIAGFHKVKQELQSAIDFLKQPRLVQQNRRSYLYGLFLVGAAGNNRTLICKATAGEAAVPLFSLSMRALLEAAHDERVSASDASKRADIQKGRHIIHNLFEQGKRVSPCVLWLDEVDLLAQSEAREIGEQWQSQIRIEMDGYDTNPAMVVIATVGRREQIDQLQLSGCFDHIMTMDGTRTKRFEAGLGACYACGQEIPEHWKYCGFCGTATGQLCSQCGTLLVGTQGVVFCYECGSDLSRQQ